MAQDDLMELLRKTYKAQDATSVPVDREKAVAKAKCHPNSYAIWDEKKQEVRCRCKGGYVWNTAGDACVHNIEKAVAQTSCRWPNSQAYWNEGKQEVRCRCKSGYVKNSEDDTCVSEGKRAESQAKTTRYFLEKIEDTEIAPPPKPTSNKARRRDFDSLPNYGGNWEFKGQGSLTDSTSWLSAATIRWFHSPYGWREVRVYWVGVENSLPKQEEIISRPGYWKRKVPSSMEGWPPEITHYFSHPTKFIAVIFVIDEDHGADKVNLTAITQIANQYYKFLEPYALLREGKKLESQPASSGGAPPKRREYPGSQELPPILGQ